MKMCRGYFKYHIDTIDEIINRGCYARLNDGRTVISKPLNPSGFLGLRFRIYKAWLVFTGKADAFKYTGQ